MVNCETNSLLVRNCNESLRSLDLNCYLKQLYSFVSLVLSRQFQDKLSTELAIILPHTFNQHGTCNAM